MVDEKKSAGLPAVRRQTFLRGKPVLIERTFGKKTHLQGQVATLECEKIRGFFLVKIVRESSGPADLSYYSVLREVRGRSKEVEGIPDWNDGEPKKVGEVRRIPNYTLRFKVGEEHIHADECEWRPLYCKNSVGDDACGGKLKVTGGHIECESCGTTYPLSLVENFPEARRLLSEGA
jgi:hypothetical protein